MNEINKTDFKTKITNLFGAFGYLFCSLQWLWAILLYFSLIDSLFTFVKTNNIDVVIDKTPAVTNPSSNISLIIFSAVIIIVMLVLTACVIVKIPSTIVKTSKKVVNETAESITPLLLKAQHRKDTKKRHLKLSSRLVLAIKITILAVPLVLSLLSRFLNNQMVDYSVAVFVSLWLACFVAVSFCLQYFIARLLKVNRKELW